MLNNHTDLLFVMFFCTIATVLLLVAFIKYFSDYFAYIKYVKRNINNAYDWNEYVYWRKELRVLLLCIIPGLTPDKVKKMSHFISSKIKYRENDGFISMILPSVLGIFLCSVLLAGQTLAWFTASQSSNVQTLQTANYSVIVTVKNEENIEQVAVDDSYGLAVGTYSVTLKTNGTATTGYCIISLGDTNIHTEQFPTKDNVNKKSITFTLLINESTAMTIVPQWGTSSQSDNNKIYDTDTYTYGEAQTIQDTNTDSTNSEDESTEASSIPSTESSIEPSIENTSELTQTESLEPSQSSEESSIEETSKESSEATSQEISTEATSEETSQEVSTEEPSEEPSQEIPTEDSSTESSSTEESTTIEEETSSIAEIEETEETTEMTETTTEATIATEEETELSTQQAQSETESEAKLESSTEETESVLIETNSLDTAS